MSYPDNNPKTQFGLKKAPLHLVPPALELGAAEAFANGAAKYGPFNWREKKISATVYYAACLRHLKDWYDRVDANDNAPDSGVHHVKHGVACLAMILDVKDNPDLFNDDRPPSRFPKIPTLFELRVGALVKLRDGKFGKVLGVVDDWWIIDTPSGYSVDEYTLKKYGCNLQHAKVWGFTQHEVEDVLS